MSVSASLERYPAFIRWVIGWWRASAERRATLTALERVGPEEAERLAHDVGLSSTDLRNLAGKWPDAADLLSKRIEFLKLDESDLKRREPEVLRDLRRVCSLCSEKKWCEHDLTLEPFDETWHDYCPNAQTLEALDAERTARPRPKAN